MSNVDGFPAHWPVVSFDSVVESTKLGLVRSTAEMSDALPYAYVRMDAISREGKLSLSDVRRTNATDGEVQEYSLSANDFLFNTRNSRDLVGKSAIFNSNGTYLFNNNLMRIRFRECLDPVFANYLFYTPVIQRQLDGMKSGTTSVFAIYYSNLAKLRIPLPPLPEQKRIAAILDQAEALRAKRRAAIKLLDELTQSIFLDMFGDPVTNPKGFAMQSLSGMLEMIGGYAFKSQDYVPSGIPLVKIGEVNRHCISSETASYLPAHLQERHRRFIAMPGDLLMSLTGTTGKDDYANLMVLDDSFEKYFVNQRVALIKTNASRLSQSYLLHVLRLPKIKSRITNRSRGIRQANISNNDVLDLEIPIPPIDRQDDFNSRVALISTMKQVMRRSSIAEDHLFASLQHRAFRGEL